MSLITPNAVLTFEGQSVELNERQVSQITQVLWDRTRSLVAEVVDNKELELLTGLKAMASAMSEWKNNQFFRKERQHEITIKPEKMDGTSGRYANISNLFALIPEVPGLLEDISGVRTKKVKIRLPNGAETWLTSVGSNEWAVRDRGVMNYAYNWEIGEVQYPLGGTLDAERAALRMNCGDNVLEVVLDVTTRDMGGTMQFGAVQIDRGIIDYLTKNQIACQELMRVIDWKQALSPVPAATFAPQAEVKLGQEFLDIDFTAMKDPRSGTITLDRAVRSIALRTVNGVVFLDGNLDPSQIGQYVTLENGAWLKVTIDDHNRTLLHYHTSEGIDKAQLTMDYFVPLQFGLDRAAEHSSDYTAVSDGNGNRAFDKVVSVFFDDVENSQLGEFPVRIGRVDTERMVRSVTLLEMNGEAINSHVKAEVGSGGPSGSISYSIGGLSFTFRPLLDQKGFYYDRSRDCKTAVFGINYADWKILPDQPGSVTPASKALQVDGDTLIADFPAIDGGVFAQAILFDRPIEGVEIISVNEHDGVPFTLEANVEGNDVGTTACIDDAKVAVTITKNGMELVYVRNPAIKSMRFRVTYKK